MICKTDFFQRLFIISLIGVLFGGLSPGGAVADVRSNRNEISTPAVPDPAGNSQYNSTWNGSSGSNALGAPQTSTRRMKTTSLTKPAEKKFFFNSFTEFTGPSADFTLPVQSYSTATDDYSPMQLYQSMSLAYAFNKNNRIGTEWSAVKPLQSDVINKYGYMYSADFVLYDPTIYYDFFNFIDNKLFWVNGRFGFSVPISEFSAKNGNITDLYLGYFWKLKLSNPNWYFGLNFEGWLDFWKNPTGYTLFTGAVGHNLGYRFTPHWSLDTGTNFDFNYISGYNNHTQFSEGAVDHLTITLRFQPIVNIVQLGTFFQAPIYDRRPQRMAFGANLNFWF